MVRDRRQNEGNEWKRSQRIGSRNSLHSTSRIAFCGFLASQRRFVRSIRNDGRSCVIVPRTEQYASRRACSRTEWSASEYGFASTSAVLGYYEGVDERPSSNDHWHSLETIRGVYQVVRNYWLIKGLSFDFIRFRFVDFFFSSNLQVWMLFITSFNDRFYFTLFRFVVPISLRSRTLLVPWIALIMKTLLSFIVWRKQDRIYL